MKGTCPAACPIAPLALDFNHTDAAVMKSSDLAREIELRKRKNVDKCPLQLQPAPAASEASVHILSIFLLSLFLVCCSSEPLRCNWAKARL